MRFSRSLIALAVGTLLAGAANANVIASGDKTFNDDSLLLFGDSFTSSVTANNAILNLSFTRTTDGPLSSLTFGLIDETTKKVVALKNFSSEGFIYEGGKKVGFDYSFADLSITGGHNYALGLLGWGKDYSGTFSYSLTTPVPEPETYALMGLGLAALIARRRKQSK
ncbi:PEP-CTERM sorting domain-containing protein [Chitiniphilus purpureus]|uniref:PEP-CTERM sorting domain-containing protein n=1 Tax=Chitiniphilus purpureus TaxID=2981137 RepID=A0ABY6DJA0_9NEIS|nr:PEP-CTERM sorting domain-containing protein [Chitiniphilus sp. CD1]UXY14420.1 PEP-CTERM sorting domain-containing protein [Chitiniphilus sp. CD1]